MRISACDQMVLKYATLTKNQPLKNSSKEHWLCIITALSRAIILENVWGMGWRGGRKMVPTYHYIVPPNASWKKKIHPTQGTVAILRPFRITVSYYPEIANRGFLSYVLKNKKELSTSLNSRNSGLLVTCHNIHTRVCKSIRFVFCGVLHVLRAIGWSVG